ncbi:cytochrome c [uncultured Vibrio sp.]|uniref:c-type cytochrome n=1 Tax=uncultured Vibrio sp. TaxID=114054 RepID=UPI00260DDF61|nr:cytochrome c [uncultured Vibrio sp.]
MIKRIAMVMSLAMSDMAFVGASEDAQVVSGEQLFRTAGGYGCATCHGLYAQGGGSVGGNIRGKSIEDIDASLTNEPTMLLLNDILSAENKQDLARYLEMLGDSQLVEWNIETESKQSTATIKKGQQAQLVVVNKSFESVSIDVSGLSPTEQTLVVAPYETKAVNWQPQVGHYQLGFQDDVINILVE